MKRLKSIYRKMKRCEDCGIILEGKICGNCDEELHILTYQTEDIQSPPSKEFLERAKQSKEKIKKRETNQ